MNVTILETHLNTIKEKFGDLDIFLADVAPDGQSVRLADGINLTVADIPKPGPQDVMMKVMLITAKQQPKEPPKKKLVSV